MNIRNTLRLAVCIVAILLTTSGCMLPTSHTLHAMFTVSESQHAIPFNASFDATLSVSLSDEISSYLWTFGDGGSGTGPVVDHTYIGDGEFKATLTIVDTKGQTAQSSTLIRAINPTPQPKFSYAPKSMLEPDQPIISASEWVTFDASESTDDEEIAVYSWYFGRTDSGEIKNAEGPTVKCRFRDAGTYSIVLTVTDNDGASSDCIQQVTVVGSQACYADLRVDYEWLSIE